MIGNASTPEREGARGSSPDPLEWLALLQYCDARSRREAAAPHHRTEEISKDPWPVTVPPMLHRLRPHTPERPWEACGAEGRTATFTAGAYVLRCGYGPRAVNAIHRETAYLERHISPYLPQLTAYGHGWLETRIAEGAVAERPGPWLHTLGHMLREMHDLGRHRGRPADPGLRHLRRVCGRDTAVRARALLRGRRSGCDLVLTHGNLRSRNIVTRANRHLLVVTGFDRVAVAAPERDTVSALLGLAPTVGIDAVARALPLALEPLALTRELLVAVDRLAGAAGGNDPGATTRRRSVQRLIDGLLTEPDIVEDIADLCRR